MVIFLKFCVALAAAGALAFLYFQDPSTSPYCPPCPTQHLTSLYCPGCGSLRAVHALLHGDFRGALSQNALAMILLPLAAVGLVFPFVLRIPFLSMIILVAVILFTILRNIPYFSFLAPH